MTLGWSGLPRAVRDVVEGHLGPVTGTTDITTGLNSDVAIVLERDGPSVFLKGVRGVSRRMRWLRNEVTAGQLAVGVAPDVLFAEDVDDWLVVAFAYLPGRHADLSPGSPDLPLVAATLERLSVLSAPGLQPLRARWKPVDHWRQAGIVARDAADGWNIDEATRWSARTPSLVDGDRLLHTDLHGGQFIINTDDRDATAHVIDWGWPAAGAAWVDTAFMVVRLVEAGHRPADAEAWARGLRTWAGVGETAITAFATYVAGLWTYRHVTAPTPGSARRTQIARDYAAWRLATIRPEATASSTRNPRPR